MKIHILHTGEVLIDRALAYKESTLHPMPFTGWFRGKSKSLWAPVSIYLIEHSKGYILVDTGWHEDIRNNQKEHLGRLINSMFKGDLPEGESVPEHLKRVGVHVRDLEYVLLTHLHADHVSGLSHVAGAKNILVSNIEWKDAQNNINYNSKMWEGVNVNTFAFDKNTARPFKMEYDLFGDQSVVLVYTPGHTKGMFSVLLQSKNKRILLASDVGYSPHSWKNLVYPGITSNKKQAIQSLEWLKSIEGYIDQIIVNHDRNIQPQTIELD
ncbi:N-acyl homoserine lactonase family protein [Salicibibacter cibarius]|uniref:N-acyl homoserine lactonase family protein n=2 Tax=Salicibibacter cibarius TaxID=2743000 RepID=A0A7T6Z576_9BACI|nr:N-acyl homoserine lactonase family protein [Salicibibacter cibarius]